MPLYKKRVKKTFSSQDTNNPKKMVSSEFKQPSCSQKDLEEILETQRSSNKSPIYPEVFPRSASEPNESAFVDGSFEKKELNLENDAFDTNNSETQLEKSLPNEISYTSKDSSEKETVLQEIADVDIVNGLSTGNIEILAPTDKIKQSYLVEHSITPEKNNIKAIPETKSKENSRKKKSIMHPLKSSKNKKKKLLDSDIGDFKENIPSQSNDLHVDLNTSLNSSISSQVSLNHPPVKEAFKNFLIKKKIEEGKKIISSQNSNISLNDPIIRDTYSQFMTKKEKFARVNTPKGLTHYDKMKWLQGQRNVGVYVYCDSCDKIRFLEEINDPTVLPDKWYCKDNSDIRHNRCDIPEEKFPLHVQEDWIDNLYNAGSIVWARVEGFPWWPAIVDDDPNTESYYWLEDEINNTPSYYHVTFFDQKEVTRAWLKPNEIKSYHKEKNNPNLLPGKFSLFKKRIDFAIKQANEALEMHLQERLEKFSFLVRYKKPIQKPRDFTNESKKKVTKYNKDYFVKEKKSGDKKEKNKKRNVNKGKKLESDDFLLDDFEIPSSPTFESISLELFENV